jgi:hypothetical protein
MDFGEQEVDFQEADRRYAELKRQLDAGIISIEEFAAQRQQMMVQDDEGRWWAKLGESGEWYYHDGSTWVRGTPPGDQEVIEPTDSQAPTPSPPHPKGAENGESGRRRVSHWMPVVGVVGITLVVIVFSGVALISLVLVPYLQGEPASRNQGEAMKSNQDKPAPDEIAFDAVFVHRATPENISSNSTYLDNPLTNGNPDAILYVTQSWNPGGGGGTYNNHPIGVWYDAGRHRWAIFNQDRKAIPEGAAFNVAVLKGPAEAR